jgi:hypothetical protein
VKLDIEAGKLLEDKKKNESQIDDEILRVNTEKLEGELIFDHLRNFKQQKDKKTITKDILKML